MAFLPIDHNPFTDIVAESQPFQMQPSDLWFSPSQMAQGARTIAAYPFRNPGETAEFGLSIAPGSGEAMSARDAWAASGRAGDALLSGEFGDAGREYLNMGTALLGALPGAGIIARGTKRGAAWMDRNLPSGVNKLLDAATPSDPQNTMNIFAGPTGPKMTRAEFDRRSAELLAEDMAGPIHTHPDIRELPAIEKRRIRGPQDAPGRPRKSSEHLVYHGTKVPVDFDKFDPASMSNDGFLYFTNHPGIASHYATVGAKSYDQLRVIPAYVDTDGFYVHDFGGTEDWGSLQLLAPQIYGTGKYKGLLAKNVIDAAESDITKGFPQNQYVVWTPGTVRSALTEAMLYGGAPALLLGSALSEGGFQPSTDDDQQIVRFR